MSTGKIVKVIGAVVDVEFDQNSVPRVYDALTVLGTEHASLVLEVQQQIGSGVVRCIAMGSSDGLRRGLVVEIHKIQFQFPLVKKRLVES